MNQIAIMMCLSLGLAGFAAAADEKWQNPVRSLLKEAAQQSAGPAGGHARRGEEVHGTGLPVFPGAKRAEPDAIGHGAAVRSAGQEGDRSEDEVFVLTEQFP